jgi:hypothetical protein
VPSDKPRAIISSGEGFFQDLLLRAKLVIRLMGDHRVNPLFKLLPIGSLLYLIIPEPAIGPIDDALVIWLGTVAFFHLCPQEIVREHLNSILPYSAVQDSIPVEGPAPDSEDIIEGEFREPGDPSI